MPVTAEEVIAFWGNCKHVPGGCVAWTGSYNERNGYGVFFFKEKTQYAHRWALEQRLGREIKPGSYSLHSCNNKFCVAHVYEGDARQNHLDRVMAGTARLPKPQQLTESDALEIRKAYGETEMTQHDLAKVFSVSRGAVAHVLSGRSWKQPQASEV